MIKKFAFLFVLISGTLYLLLPAPKNFPPPPGGVKSIEPGDTTQIANVSAYYTDISRKDILDYYQKYFSKSTFLGIPLITYRLNHPPERIREVLRNTQQSTYVEEIIHPLRESVFINGFEWNNDPFTPAKSRAQNILIVNGKTYQFKVTIFYQESKTWSRILIFYLTMTAIYFLDKYFKEWLGRWPAFVKTNVN